MDVQQGEVVGIIGRNGAGKSTLLKILSRITVPTSGRVELRGRVGSLLEVGTGFHAELTGRENIFLNGSILGMSRREILRKFDEIVDFSGVERFLDTPVKRYSSGMHVRLAFAVAAHLEPPILIVDEVLAVGDAEFQKKCLGKMKHVAGRGRTILFVSHNMNAVSSLCTRAVVLRNGKVQYDGRVREAMACYGASRHVAGTIDFANQASGAILKTLRISQDGEPSNGVLEPLREVDFRVSLVAPCLLANARLGLSLTNANGDRAFAVASWLGPEPLPPICGERTVQIKFAMPPLVPGRYTIDVGFYDRDRGICEEYYSATTVEVAEINYLQTTVPVTAEIGQLYVRSKCFVS